MSFSPSIQSSSASSSSSNNLSLLAGNSSFTNLESMSMELESERPCRTGVICTIGPSTWNEKKLGELIDAGMNICRINFSHGDQERHAETIRLIRQVEADKRTIVAIMLDTKGPEIRTGPLDGDVKEVELEEGQAFTFTTNQEVKGTSEGNSISYKNITKVVKEGNTILVDDGLIEMRVLEVTDTEVKCVVINGGMLGGTKGVNLPGVEVDLPALTKKDIADIEFGVEQGVDMIAASFIRSASNINEIREIEGVLENKIKIIAKIESQEGIDNYDSILEAANGIMVARGDLGVEVPLERVATFQKSMIAKANQVGKPIITATQMLDSMTHNPRPTRAEATDVANAVYDGTDCVMLSGETAKGDYPVEAVATMVKICKEAEANINYTRLYRNLLAKASLPMTVPQSVCSSCVKTASDLAASLIIALTESGNTARLISQFRPSCPIMAITPSIGTSRQMLLSRSCIPYVTKSMKGTEFVIERGINKARELGLVREGDIVVVASGLLEGVSGSINMLRVVQVSPST